MRVKRLNRWKRITDSTSEKQVNIIHHKTALAMSFAIISNKGVFFKTFILFIYFWLRWVFIVVCGLLIAVASLVGEHGL